MQNWKQRAPSHTFDPVAVWDDIAISRLFFLDQYSLRFQNQPMQQATLSDIQVMLHIQTAKGAFKMGLYDSSDRYLKVAQSKRTHSNQNDMRIIVPIIKLKTEQCKSELRNMSFEAKISRLDKIHSVLTRKIDENNFNLGADVQQESGGVHLDPERDNMSPLEKVQTMYKSHMLKFHLQKKMLTITLTQAQVASGLPEVQQH